MTSIWGFCQMLKTERAIDMMRTYVELIHTYCVREDVIYKRKETSRAI